MQFFITYLWWSVGIYEQKRIVNWMPVYGFVFYFLWY